MMPINYDVEYQKLQRRLVAAEATITTLEAQLAKVREAIGMHDGGRIDEQDAYGMICELLEQE